MTSGGTDSTYRGREQGPRLAGLAADPRAAGFGTLNPRRTGWSGPAEPVGVPTRERKVSRGGCHSRPIRKVSPLYSVRATPQSDASHHPPPCPTLVAASFVVRVMCTGQSAPPRQPPAPIPPLRASSSSSSPRGSQPAEVLSGRAASVGGGAAPRPTWTTRPRLRGHGIIGRASGNATRGVAVGSRPCSM